MKQSTQQWRPANDTYSTTQQNGYTIYQEGEIWFVTCEGKKTIQGPSEYVATAKTMLIRGLACCKSLVCDTPVNKIKRDIPLPSATASGK